MLAAFVIDERECESPAEMKSIRNEALVEIQRRRIVGEFETRRAKAGELPSTLPRWAAYKRRLESWGLGADVTHWIFGTWHEWDNAHLP